MGRAKAIRNGLRFGDLLHFEEFERRLRDLIAWSQKRFDIRVKRIHRSRVSSVRR